MFHGGGIAAIAASLALLTKPLRRAFKKASTQAQLDAASRSEWNASIASKQAARAQRRREQRS